MRTGFFFFGSLLTLSPRNPSYLIPRGEMFDTPKRGESNAIDVRRPVRQEINIVARLGQQGKTSLTAVAPIAANKGMTKMPKSNLEKH